MKLAQLLPQFYTRAPVLKSKIVNFLCQPLVFAVLDVEPIDVTAGFTHVGQQGLRTDQEQSVFVLQADPADFGILTQFDTQHKICAATV
jgi:hypothetical protein